MKTPDQLKQEALARAAKSGGGLYVDPNSQAAREMMAQQQAAAMAARLVIEAASSIYVRQVSQFSLEGLSNTQAADLARDAFRVAKVFLDVANEPVERPAPAVEKPATDANGSPVVELEG